MITPFRVRAYEIVHLPIGTHLAGVYKSGRPPAEILPVVRVDTDFTVVVIFSIRAPDCLEVEHVEVHINVVLFN